jgi:hypothetical protein
MTLTRIGPPTEPARTLTAVTVPLVDGDILFGYVPMYETMHDDAVLP